MIYNLVCGTLGVLFSLLGHLVHTHAETSKFLLCNAIFAWIQHWSALDVDENNAMPVDRRKISLDASKVDRECEFLTTELERKLSRRFYKFIPTLRQAWSRKRSITAICVQDVDDQCVLQITLIHAVCCALHRLASQVIHRIGLYLCLLCQLVLDTIIHK